MRRLKLRVHLEIFKAKFIKNNIVKSFHRFITRIIHSSTIFQSSKIFFSGALLNLSNRVSFALGLRGPSFTLDSACSSAITALDIAVKYMRSGACETALVAGSNLILHPNNSLQYGE